MSLVNFTDPSLEQLRGILGSYGNEQVGRLIKSTATYVESRWFKVTDEVTITEGQDETTEYKASEVSMDGTIVPNGIRFDSDATTSNKPDDPVYFKNLKINADLFTGAVEVGKAYQVEFVSPRSYEDETQYYIVPKGGGGGVQYGVVESDGDQNNFYNITLYSSRSSIGAPNPNDTVLLNMNIYSNYGKLPIGFSMPVSLIDGDIYEPIDIQSTCFGVVVGRSSEQGQDHPYDNYDLTVTTSPYGGGFSLGTITATAPNVDYGVLGNGAKQTLQFVKENNAWYMNPATFGVY